MKTIYKYPVPADDTVLTLRGRVLSAGVQDGNIMVWATHDETLAEREVQVSVMGTGHPFVEAPDTDFLGTVFLGPLVFHVFVSDV